MKQLLLTTVSSLALTSIASAADLPARMPIKAPPLAVVQSWAGPYIGLNGGAVWHRLETDTTLTGFGAFDTARIRTTGGTFGGQIGYNWQSQNFVYGLEADLNWVGGKGSDQHNANNGVGVAVLHTTRFSWLGTVRARGGLAFGQTLVFGTGGLAVGGVKNSWVAQINCAAATPCQLSDSATKVGWTAGGGIEHFITSNMTVKAEALYVDLGRKTVTDIWGFYTSRFKNTAVLGRLGVNLKW